MVAALGRKTATPPPPGCIRGNVVTFSRKSRTRLLRKLNSIDREAVGVPHFVTLTYPGQWDRDPASWKRHLDAWAKRLGRKFPEAFAVWKLEPQKRGAPHFHLLVFGAEGLDGGWVRASWYEVVDSGDPRHLRHGADVQLVRSWRGVNSYASKYMGKLVEDLDEEWRRAGRWWGIINRAGFDAVVHVERFSVPESIFYRLRRVWRRFAQRPGWKPSTATRDASVRVFMPYRETVRAIRWAYEYDVPHERAAGTHRQFPPGEVGRSGVGQAGRPLRGAACGIAAEVHTGGHEPGPRSGESRGAAGRESGLQAAGGDDRGRRGTGESAGTASPAGAGA